MSVSELVNQAPAPTLDGSLMMGSQHTTVFLIDGTSGQLLRTFYDFDGELAALSAMGTATLGAYGVHAAVQMRGCGSPAWARTRRVLRRVR